MFAETKSVKKSVHHHNSYGNNDNEFRFNRSEWAVTHYGKLQPFHTICS